MKRGATALTFMPIFVKTSHPSADNRQKQTQRMDSLMSLGAPLKQFTSCVSGKNPNNKRGANRSQSVRRNSFARRKSVSRRRSLPCSSQKVPDSWLRAYQDELKRERYGSFSSVWLDFLVPVLGEQWHKLI